MSEVSLVSIVIPCYNDYRFVGEAVDTAIDQTYPNKEIIIVDDGSDSRTKQVLASICHEEVKLITQKNKGLSAARNRGFSEAKGDFILLLDSDDKFDKTFVEKAMYAFSTSEHCGVVTCWGQKFMDNKYFEVFKPLGGGIENFLFQNAAIGTSMVKKQCWVEVGGYDENMTKGYEDWEFYIRLTQKWNVCVVPEVLFFYRQRKNSMKKVALQNYDKEIKSYIFSKHMGLYKENFTPFVSRLLSEIERERNEKIKNIQRIEFKIGKTILSPIRYLKSLLK